MAGLDTGNGDATTASGIDDFVPIVSNDLVCEVCSTPLTYSGRGRKPKRCDEHKDKRSTGSSSRSRAGEAAVQRACDTMDTLYNTALLPLMFVSPSGAAVWEKQIDGLNRSNRTFLATNPDLVKRINAVGEKGGTAAFAITHILAVLPVMTAVAADFRAGAMARAEARAAREAADFVDEGPADPDAAFRGFDGDNFGGFAG